MSRTILFIFFLAVASASKSEDGTFNDRSSQVQKSVTMHWNVPADVVLMVQRTVKQTKSQIESPKVVFKNSPVQMEVSVNNYEATRAHASSSEAAGPAAMMQVHATSIKDAMPAKVTDVLMPRVPPTTARMKRSEARNKRAEEIKSHLKTGHLSSKHTLLAITGAVIFIFVLQNTTRLATQNVGDSRVSLLQGLSMLFEFYTAMNNTAAIPHSYFLVSQLGYGPVVSGVLISAPSSVGILSAYIAKKYSLNWDQVRNRALVVASCFFFSVFTAVFAIAANPPHWLHMSKKACFVVLLLARMSQGFCYYIPALLRMMVQKMTPAKELVTFNLYWTISSSLGTGCGPLIATLGACTSKGVNDELDAALTMYYIAAILLIHCIICGFTIPRDISDLIANKESKDAESEDAATTPLTSNEPGIISRKKTIWLQGCWFNFERCLIVIGLEAGAAMVFEVEYSLNSSDTGIILSFAFVAGLPFMWIFHHIKAKGWVTAQTLLFAMTFAVCIAIIFLFSFFRSKWLFIFALAVIFPCAYVANGYANGLAMLHSVSGTFHCQENMMLVQCVMFCIGRTMGAPVSRALVSRGRDAYVIYQLALACVSCIGAFRLRQIVNEVEMKTS